MIDLKIQILPIIPKVCWWAHDHILQVHQPRVQPPLEGITNIQEEVASNFKFTKDNDWGKDLTRSVRTSWPTSPGPQKTSEGKVGFFTYSLPYTVRSQDNTIFCVVCL